MAKKSILKESYPAAREWSDEEIANEFVNDLESERNLYNEYLGLTSLNWGLFNRIW